jgi:hypothetical protein
MKAAVMKNNLKTKAPAYPNAADRSYYLHKLLDGALAVATAVGGVVALVFLLLL